MCNKNRYVAKVLQSIQLLSNFSILVHEKDHTIAKIEAEGGLNTTFMGDPHNPEDLPAIAFME